MTAWGRLLGGYLSYGPNWRDPASPFWCKRRRIDTGYSDPVICYICGAPCSPGRLTCSDDCHEKLVYRLERDFGVYKKVVDLETGKTHRVLTRDIVERGLRQIDLKNYPEWRENEDSIYA